MARLEPLYLPQETPQANPGAGALSGLSALMEVPEGPAGIAVTLNQMIAWTRAYRTDPGIINIASQIVAGLPNKAYFDEAHAIQNFVKGNIRYTRDVAEVEALQTPPVTLARGQGDCDDQALLVGALLQAIGFPVRYVAFALQAPGEFEHVYAEVKLGTRWYGMETTEPDAFFGWTPQTPYPPMIRTV